GREDLGELPDLDAAVDRGALRRQRHPGDQLPRTLRHGGLVHVEAGVGEPVRGEQVVAVGDLGDASVAGDRAALVVDHRGGVLDTGHPAAAVPELPGVDVGDLAGGDTGDPLHREVRPEAALPVVGLAAAGVGVVVGDELLAVDVGVGGVG